MTITKAATSMPTTWASLDLKAPHGRSTVDGVRAAVGDTSAVLPAPGATHRHGCLEPGWAVSEVQRPIGWQLARCRGCGVVELRRARGLG